MPLSRAVLVVAVILLTVAAAPAQKPGAAQLTPNLVGSTERPLRYRPDGHDFVITNGRESFNRPLYGGGTAFRVDGGDRPEFVLYLPGRGGNLRLGLQRGREARWLIDSPDIETRYRPGSLLYTVRDPLLGTAGRLQVEAIACHQTEGFLLRVVAEEVAEGVELIAAYGGINGQRGVRDGDIGTERVPIGEWFQLQPAFCRDNRVELAPRTFTVHAVASMTGVVPDGSTLAVAEAAHWADLGALLASATTAAPPALPIVISRTPLRPATPLHLSVQRVNAPPAAPGPSAISTAKTAPAAPIPRRPAFAPDELPAIFDATRAHFAALRTRVSVDTPDAFLNAAVAALNIAADAVWDEPQQAIMHGAIAWRTKLLGWRGPYALDALGWHDRARRHFRDWATRQNLTPIPAQLPPADENANLARNEAGLHSHGDLSNSHYDMNAVFIDALFRHLRWTGDLGLAEELWPVIERHLAWERRLFRREFGPEKLPLYEAYAAIWASDDLHYHGGGTAHGSAYNFFHHQQAAQLARLLGHDPAPYEREAALIARGLREHLWFKDRGGFAEYKDLLGLQRVHPSIGLWSFYHVMDAELPTPDEAWAMTRQVDTQLPHLPVHGPGVPAGLQTLSTTAWMPYLWSINNVVMGETLHTSLGFWQAGRPDAAWPLAKGALVAAMFMGISPGNVGSMSYLDVYRRESQRDFADGSGVLARTLIEGLFGVKPDLLAGQLHVAPGWPADWARARLHHPDFDLSFQRTDAVDRYALTPRFPRPVAVHMRLAARRDTLAALTVNGAPVVARRVEDPRRGPQLEFTLAPAPAHEVVVTWAGDAVVVRAPDADDAAPRPKPLEPNGLVSHELQPGATFEPVPLGAVFNDRVTQIFQNEYRSPRSPFVSLALPKQGLGGWAGNVNQTADIDDAGLRAVAAAHDGQLRLPNGLPLATPSAPGAPNVVFTSQWDNYPRAATVPLTGRASQVTLLVAGSTHAMQSRFENGEIVVAYTDGTAARLPLENPTNWWPIQEDYFIDDFQFRRPEPLPMRVDLRTGEVRSPTFPAFKGRGGPIPGGAATVLHLPLDPTKTLQSLTVRTLANDVVVGLLAATLVRP